MMRYVLNRDRTVNVKYHVDPPRTKPQHIRYNVQNIRHECFQKIIWPDIITFIIDITNVIRTQTFVTPVNARSNLSNH